MVPPVPGYQEIRRLSLAGEVERRIRVSSAASSLMVDSTLARYDIADDMTRWFKVEYMYAISCLEFSK